MVDLVTAIIKARAEGIGKDDRPSDPIELIVRRMDGDGGVREEFVLRIRHQDAVDRAEIEALFGVAIDRLARPGNEFD